MMQGVVLLGNRQLEMQEFPIPEPGPQQVLVRMKASGLCGSDLRAIYRPTPPKPAGSGEWKPEAYRRVIAGHEPCGQIVAVGERVRRFRVDDRVIMYHIAGCGLCAHCRRGWMINCSSEARAAYGWQRDGGHADFLLAEENTLVPLPDALSYVDGSMVACGLGTAYAACCRAAISARDVVMVTGLGPVGLGVTLLCKAMGTQVIGIEVAPERLQSARELGVDHVIEAGEHALSMVRDVTHGHGVEVAIDCSGNASARHLCLEAAREWGRVVYVGEGGTVSFSPSPLLLHKQLTLHGSWVCSVPQMEELVEKLIRWDCHPDKLVSHRFALEQAREAYELFDTGKTAKVVIVMDDQ